MFSRHIRLFAVLSAAAALTACGRDSTPEASARPIELAPAKQEPPPLADAPVVAKAEPAKAPTQKRAAPRPAPITEQKRPETPIIPATVPTPVPVAAAPAPPTTGTVDVGTPFALKPATKICTNTHKTGDQFTATLAHPLTGTNGLVVPEGSIAMLRIVEGSGETRTDSVHLTYDLISLRTGDQTYEVTAHVTQSAPIDRVNTQSRTDAAKKVGAGAIIGAIAGRVIGGNTKGAVIGGAVGAAAGAAVAVKDNKVEGCLRGDGLITLALDRPLTIRLANAP